MNTLNIGQGEGREVKNEKSEDKTTEDSTIFKVLTLTTCPNCRKRYIAYDGRCPRCGRKEE